MGGISNSVAMSLSKLQEKKGPLESKQCLVMQEGTTFVEGGKMRGQKPD